MKILISENFTATTDFDVLGYLGEANARTIEVEQPNLGVGIDYRLKLKYEDGAVFNVPIVQNKVTVTASLLRAVGDIQCQWEAVRWEPFKEEYSLVAKSNIFSLSVANSIDGNGIPSYEETEYKLKEVQKLYENIKRAAYDNAIVSQNYTINPVVLRIPGSVEYVKDGEYSTNFNRLTSSYQTNFTSSSDGIRYTGIYPNNYITRSIDQSISKSSGKSYMGGAELNQPSIRHLIFEEGVKQVGDHAFYNQSYLDRIEFPKSLEWVHADAFTNTKWLNDKGGEVYCGNNVFYKYRNTEYLNISPDPKSSVYAYVSRNQHVKIKDGVKTISSKAFYQSTYPYYGCLKIKDIDLPDSLIGIGDYAFAYVGYHYSDSSTYDPYYYTTGDYATPCRISIPDNVSWIGEYAFYKSALKGLTVPPKIQRIQAGSYAGCDLRDNPITIPSSVKSIDTEAFKYAKFKELIIEEGVEYIGIQAFSQVEVDKIILPNSVKKIEYNAFYNSKVKELHIPSTVEIMGDSVFNSCNNLVKLTVGENFNCNRTSFSGCNNLSVESVNNLITNLADRSDTYTGQLILGSVNTAKLSNEKKAEASAKNWSIS